MVLFFIEKEVRKTRIEELKQQEARIIALEDDFLSHELGVVLSDLHYLHHAYEKALFDSRNYGAVSENWLEFSSQRQVYDQIRYIDTKGDEKIRINLGEDGGYAVPEEDLQNKKDRYYYTETVKLQEESVYISPLDLNVEGDSIEIPYKPMLRFSTPLYNDSGELEGMIVLNYQANTSLSRFRELASYSQGEIILLNADGYRLSSKDPSRDWNFMFDDKLKNSFATEFPSEWEAIKQNSGQFTTANGLFSATQVTMVDNYIDSTFQGKDQQLILGSGDFYVVSVYQRNNQNRAYFNDNQADVVMDVLQRNLFYFLLMTIISGLVGLIVYVKRKTYMRIKYFSEIDALTKTLNRRAGMEKLHDLFPADDRRHYNVSLCLIDINGLKEVNDTLGHKHGDELIKTVADVIKGAIREDDFLVRLGGDEFLIVFYGIGIEKAEDIWHRIVDSYNRLNQVESKPYLISVSHGIVDFENKQKTQIDDLISAADEKMYHEKKIIKADLKVIRELK